MNFNKHLDIQGQHAFLGGSKYHWINYDEEKLVEVYSRFLATQRGVELHDFASTCIKLKQRLPKSQKSLNMYVNDAITFRMIPEQILKYSNYCWGTADSISYSDSDGLLRIHDLKTGVVPGHIEQLIIYSAIFLLEYKKIPKKTELRIYQFDEVLSYEPTQEEIQGLAEKIISFDKVLFNLIEKD